MHLLLIVNPAASRGDTGALTERVVTAVKRRELSFELVETRHAGHATELLRERASEFDTVVPVGGDGTLHEVVQSLDLERHRLGLIPRGSGNDWAWANGWPADIEACVDRIAAARERRIDLGLWRWNREHEGRFHNSIGCGFEAAVNHESQRIRRLRGSTIYVVAALRCLLRRTGYRVRVRREGEPEPWCGNVLQISVANGARVGGTFLLTPEARIDDGVLDICQIERVGLLRALFLLPRTFRGRHLTSPAVTMSRATRLEIEAPEGLPVHVDGEFVAHDVTHLDIRVAPGALRTL